MILKHIYVEELVTISSESFLWGCVSDYSFFKRVGIYAYGPPSIPLGYEHSDINLGILIEEIKRV